MTRLSPSTLPRKSASQERSKLMVETLLDATARVLTQEGYDKASTNRIALVAGVSIGSLYQYFPNKESLVGALVSRHIREMMDLMKSALEDMATQDLESSMRRVISAMIDAHRVDPDLHRVFDEQVPRMDHLIDVETFEREGYQMVRGFLEQHRERILVRDLDMATSICMTSIEALTHEIITRNPAPADDWVSTYVDEVTRLVVGYLCPPPGSSR